MSRDYRLFLEDILESCTRIERYTRAMSFDQFVKDDKTYDAVLRNLEIIGEAVKNLPEEVRLRYNQIEWRKLAGLRDIVAHEYFGVSDEIVWDVIQTKLSSLRQEIIDIIGQE